MRLTVGCRLQKMNSVSRISSRMGANRGEDQVEATNFVSCI